MRAVKPAHNPEPPTRARARRLSIFLCVFQYLSFDMSFKTVYEARSQLREAPGVIMSSIFRRTLPVRCSACNAVLGLWVLSFAFGLKTIELHASPQTASARQGKNENPRPWQRDAVVPRAEAEDGQLLERWEHIVHRTKAGESIVSLLNRFNLSPSEKRLWMRSIQREVGIKPAPPGKEIHFYTLRPAGSSHAESTVQLKAVEIDYNSAWSLTWEKGAWGISFEKREKPYDVELKTVSGAVETSLFEDARKAGVQPSLLSQLADIFSWDIDFDKDIQPGDRFKILYEARSRKGQEPKTTLRILAAELINAGQKLTAIYFEKQKGTGAYYNLEGRNLARAFLRFPLEFTSITSHFSESRFHPILKTNIPHIGVDFAAQRGTPVRAVGDGVITQAGRNGAYGKTIDIQHDATYRTRYAHLHNFAQGIRSGASVKKGQVIGYVGSTGRATGPHLHFEFYKDEQYVDPLGVYFPAEDEIEPALQRVFESQKSLFLVQLASLPQS